MLLDGLNFEHFLKECPNLCSAHISLKCSDCIDRSLERFLAVGSTAIEESGMGVSERPNIEVT